MGRSARARLAITAFAVLVVMTGITVPARADAPGAPGPDPAQYTPPFELLHPVGGRPGFSDTFGASRDGGDRLHHGIDIGAPLGTPVLATAAGVISRIDTGETAGLFVEIKHADGWHTRYLHLNNEPLPTPAWPAGSSASQDEEPPGEGATSTTTTTVPAEGPDVATTGVPPGIAVGVSVGAGDVIGYVGYSGNASSQTPHLHFELRMRDWTPVNPYPFLTGRAEPTTRYVVPDITEEPVADSMEIVGHIDPGDGFNGVVWAYAGVAYLGTYGTETACPATGMRRYDVTDPAAPAELEPISVHYPGTWTPALWVGPVTTSAFSGTLAVVAHRRCDETDIESFGGLALYDVTDAAAPALLSTFDAGPGTGGVADLDVSLDGMRAIVAMTVPNSLLAPPGAGDVRIVDITDPRTPVQIADWDLRRDLVGNSTVPQIDQSDRRAEGVAIDSSGHRAFVAYWNAGVVVLDLAIPDHPELVGWHLPTEHREGAAATATLDPHRGILAIGYRDLNPLADEIDSPDWGIGAILDAGKPGEPSLRSVYALDEAKPDRDGRIPLDGIYTPLSGAIVDDRLYVTWGSGGLRVFDLTDPEQPFEIASFTPPTRVDPQHQLNSPNGNIAMPLAWGIHVVNDVVFLADLNTGLWILHLNERRSVTSVT